MDKQLTDLCYVNTPSTVGEGDNDSRVTSVLLVFPLATETTTAVSAAG